MSKLIILGAVHRDPFGKRRLLTVLENIKPAAISLEVSPASVQLRNQWQRQWRAAFKKGLIMLRRETGSRFGQLMAGAALRGVFEYLRLPYEYRAALAYADEKGLPLFLLDDSELAAAYLSRVKEEILNEKNMRLLHQAGLNKSMEEEIIEEYRRARYRVFGPIGRAGPNTDHREAWTKREASLANKLRLLHQGLVRRAGRSLTGKELMDSLIIAPEAVAFMPQRLTFEAEPIHLYVCGWEHLIEDRAGETFYSHLKDLNPERMLIHDSKGIMGDA